MFTPTGSASISSFSTNVLEDLTGYLGTTSGTAIPNWQAQGTDTRGNLANGETGFTSGGWYGSNNISFSGTGTAENGTGTLRLVNNTGATITGFRVVYTGYTFRNGSASPTTSVSYSVSASSTVPTTTAAFSNVLSSLAMTDAASASGTVFAQSVTGVSIAASNYLFLRWHNPGNSNGDCLGWDNVYFIPTPTTQSSGLSFSSVTTSAMTISWSNGNGRRRAVFVRAGGVGSITNPVEGTKYTANTVFATGGASQLGTSGYYCVYDGTGSTVSVTGLSASTSYFVKIFEYNSDASPTANTITYNTTSPTSGSQATSALCSTPTAYNVTGTGSYCAGGTGLAVGLDNSTTGVNYQLYNGAATVGSPVAGNTGSPISFGLQTIAGTYTVLATTAVGGCTAGMTGSAVITINSLPTVGFSPSAPAICSGGAGVAITASGASTYTWVPTSTLTASTGATVTATPTTTTTYTITGTSAEGCTGINTVTVSVNPLPTPIISGDVTIPSGGSAVLTFSGTEGDIVYFWNGASTVSTTITASGTSTVSVSPAGTTVYSVTSATSALGCSQSITGETATVTISSLPSASISGTASICPGGNTNLLFSGTAGATVFFSTDGATPQNVVLSGTSGIGTYTLNVTPPAATTYTLDSIVSDSYHGSLSGSATVSIYAVPTAYTVTGGGSYCSGGSGLAVGLSTSQTDVTYQLYNGGVTAGAPVAGTGSSISFGTFTATGTYSVLATDDNTACANAMASTVTVSINALPAITSITTDGPVCQGASLQLSATISGTSAPYTYSWSGSSGFTSSVSSSSLTNTVSTSAMPGTPSTPTYTVVVTDANGCTSTGTNTVSTSVISFTAGTISGTTSVSVGLTTTLTSNGTSGGTWSSSDVTKATIGSASGIVTGVANGTARITYTVTNSCGTVTATTNVTVTALTPSTITSNSWSGTTSSTSTASDPSGFPTVPSATGVVFSQWQRGSGLGGNTGGSYNSNSFASASLSGAQSGNDYLYFTVTNNASTEVKLTQLFLQTQVSSSGPTSTQLLYKIGSGAEQTFSTVQATTTSGSASTETYSGAACLPPGTTTEFRLYGWGGTSAGTFRVNAGTSVTGTYVSGVSALGATAGNSSPVCSGNSITLSGNPTNGAPPYTYEWDGPSSFTSTAQSPTTSAVTAAGTYTFAVTDQLGCSATATTVSTVNANPVAVAGASTICVATTTTYTNASGGGTWASSNTSIADIGSTSGLLTPNSAGVTTISYQLSTGCYAVKTVTVAEMPATITGATSVCVGGASTFANSVSGGTWSSSNTAIGTIGSSSGTVSALSAGTTAISYSIVPGCEAEVVLTVNSTPTAAPSNSGPICVGGTVTLSANPGGSASTYSWSGPSLSSTTAANPTATPTVTSVYSLTVSNGTSDAGCAPATVYTTLVTVRPTPTAAPANNGYICIGGTVSLTANPANGANTYNWTGASVSSSTTENPTATPTTTSVYSLTVSDGTGDAGCAPATVYTTSVTVNSTPTAAPTNSSPICNGGTVNLAANGSAGATAYTWAGSSLSSTTATNPTATPTVTSVYSLTVSDGSGQPGCSPTTVYTTSVTVNSTPTAAPSNSGPICVGGTVTLSANPGGSTTTYAWSGSSLSSTTAANPTATPTITSVYTLTVSNGTSDAGCAPATVYTTMVTVRPTPTAAPSNNGYICLGGTVSLAANPANGANTYNWTGASVSSATTENPTATPTSTSVYSLTVSDGTGDAGCSPATVYTTSVTVNSTPTAAPTNSGPICNGGTVNLAANGSAGATAYTWSGASLSASTATNPTATPTTTSVYSLTVSDGSGQPGCSPTTVYTTSVTVNSTPTAAPSNSGSICVGGIVTLSANPGGSATTYSWSGPSLSATTAANPTATPTVTSVYSLTVSNGTSDAGCAPATVYTTMVTVRPTPTAAPSNNGYICVGGTVSLTANPANGANTYSWTGASVSSATTENPTATPTSTSVYSLTVSDGTGDAGCSPATVYTTSVTVNSPPTAAPTNSGPICNGGTVNLAANGSAGATNYTWSGSSLFVTTAANPTATPTTTSVYSLTVSDGSGQPGCAPATVYTTSVTVNSTPTAAPSNSGPICVGGTVTLSANPGGSATTYSWSGLSLSSTTAASPTATPTVTSVYSLTVSNGTSDAGCSPATVYTTMVTVRPTPTAAPANNGYICIGGTVSLTANPANGANTYNWSGASVSSTTAENPTAIPTATTVYSLTVSDGTGDAGCAPATVYTTSVTVNSTPTAAPTNSGPICNGGTVNLAANGSAGATSYIWSGASLSATTAANPTATPTTTSVYSLTVSDGSGQPGCSPATVYTTSVTVNSTPTAAPSNSGPICVGGTVTLSANPGGSTTTYAWSGSSLSSTTAANPTATPTVTSVYSLTVSNGTSDAGCSPATVYTTTVTVRPTPTAAPSNNGYICVGGTVSLAANPANGANTYNWTGTSVSSATTENPTATPTATSVYSLTVSDGTGDAGCAPATVYTTSVTVNSTPTAAPTNSGPICNGGTVNLAANGSAGATAYTWSGASLSASTATNPTATPTTTSVYSLTVSDGSGQPGCSPTTVYTTSVTVNSTPTAAPSNSGPICVGGTVTLSANPGGSATTYSWSGPSLSSTTVASPTATPTVTSVYSLTVSNGTSDAGCSPATVYTTMVTVRPTPTAAPANNGYICVGGTVSLTANPANGANTYNWAGASVSSATTENPTATPTSTSVYSLTVSDGTGDAGCAPATVYTTSVTVNSTPTAAPTNSGPICNGGTVNLAANGSAGATAYTWAGSSLSSTTAANTTAIPTTTSVYSLTVSDGSGQPGCSPTTVYTTSVTVNSTPTAAPSNSGPICVGGTVTLSANPGGSTTTYSWSGPSLSSTTAANPTATPTITSVYSLTVSNGTSDAGCAPTTVYTTTVTVRPTPTAAPSNNGYICVGGTVSLTANPANGANTYNWTGASVSSATTENPTATPTTTTVYSLTVSDGTGDAGCAPATVYTTSVTVNSTPTAAPSNSGPTCAGGTINLISNSAGGATTYFWSGPALSSPIVANPVAAPTVTSVYSLTVSDGSSQPGCAPSTVYTTSVTVNSVAGIVPTVVSSGGSTICEGESSSLSTSGADDYIWVPSTGLSANTGATVVATPSATTTYTVTGAKDGCTNIAVVTVSVNPVPQAITGTFEVCKSTFVILSSTTPIGVWSSSNPSIATVTSTTGQVSGVGGGTATITYTKDGCFTSREVTVHAPAAITSTGYPSMCIGQTYALGHPEAGGVWSSSSNLIASVNSSGLVTGVNYGTATITYTTIHSCNITKQVTVGMPAPIDGMQWACLNSTIDLDHSVAGGTWSSSNPARATVDATTGVVYGVSLGNFYITYTLFPGCYRAMEMAVQTFPLDISGSLSICEGASTTLANETASGTWSSSDTTVASIALSAGTAIGLSSGTTNITYKFQGCYHSEVLTVNALPTDIVGANELCEGSSATYSSMPTGGTWMSGNTSRASIGLSSGSAFGVGSGSVLITYTAPLSGCRKTKSILVNSRPGILSGIATVCAGNNTTITSMADGGTWSSSNLSVATVGTALAWSTSVSGLAAGTTDIVVSSPMGCTRSVTVTVNAAPSAIGGGSSMCTGGTLQLTNAATGGSWTTSISSIATVNSSGLVTGMAPGTAIITYATSLACFVTKQITVNSLPGAILGPNRVCVGSVVTLTHADAGGTWTSSTPTRATVDATSGQVTGISTGVVYITYNAGSGCLRTTTLTVNPIPASISGASALCEGTTSAFTNTTPNGTWTSSNLSVASVPSSPGNVSGVNAGVATITYMVTITGCFTTKDVTVNTRPASISGASQVCVGSVSTYASAPSGGIWTSSMPTRASVDPVSGQVEGISTGSATLTYSFSTGCYRTQTITVNPIPLPIGGSSAVCRGATTALNAFTSGGTWSSGNTTIASIAATGVVTGVSSGTADITYKLIATGCQVTRQVTVNELPSAISGVDHICIGSDQSFTSLPSGGTWTSSATAKATIGSVSGTATGIAQGVAVLTYAAPTTGCVTTRQISVNPIPAAITSTASTVCVGNSILLTSLTAGQTWVSTSAAISLTPTSATTASVVGTSAGSAIVSYVNGSGCFRMITLNVSPAVAPITGDMVVCPTRTIQLSTTATGGTWASALTSKATVNAAGLVTGVNAGNVNISYVVSPGCNAVVNITVNANPASIYGATYVCVGDSVDLNHAISGGVWNTTSALVSVNASNGMVTGISTGTSTITYSINSGCWVTAAINVRPTPAPITGSLTVPVGSTSALANTTGGGVWSSSATGIATISSSGMMAGVSPGNAIITYRVTSTQCYVTGNATVSSAAGKVADQEDAGYIKVYPNPTNGRLNIEASCNGVFSLYTLDGKLLQQSSTEKPATIVSLPGNLSAGVYMCRFDGADGSSRVIRIVYQP